MLKSSWRYMLVITWITLTVALAGWWLVFGLRQNDGHQRMILSEGAFLISLVLTGGIFLLYYMALERRHFERVSQFFATYTHDLKTSLASLRIQAEALQEDLQGQADSAILGRLVKDTVRLELQLENSLYIANPDAKLFVEKLSLKKSMQTLRYHWPELTIEIHADCEVMADSRALESILKNLVQNAVAHGGATRIDVSCTAVGPHVQIVIHDNGRGFAGDVQKLGQLFVRHNSTSGSGVGLHLVQRLLVQMQGQFRVRQTPQGFAAELILPGRLS